MKIGILKIRIGTPKNWDKKLQKIQDWNHPKSELVSKKNRDGNPKNWNENHKKICVQPPKNWNYNHIKSSWKPQKLGFETKKIVIIIIKNMGLEYQKLGVESQKVRIRILKNWDLNF